LWRILRPDAYMVLSDSKVRASLKRYFRVMEDDAPAKFLISRRLEAEYDEEAELKELWDTHNKLLKKYEELEAEIDSKKVTLAELEKPEKSFLDLKVAIANRILQSCHLCIRRCGATRLKGGRGYCRCGD